MTVSEGLRDLILKMFIEIEADFHNWMISNYYSNSGSLPSNISPMVSDGFNLPLYASIPSENFNAFGCSYDGELPS